MKEGIEVQYQQLSDALIAAIIREPHNFRKYVAKITPAWFSASRYDQVTGMIWRLQKQYGKFSANGLIHECQKSGINFTADDAAVLMRNASGVDLEMAYQCFEPVYKMWVEHRAAQMIPGAIMSGMTAEGLRRKQDEFRRESGAYIIAEDWNFDTFDRWVEDKLEGYEPDYPCKPHLLTMRARLKYYEPGAVMLIAARPGMGKTQLGLNMLEHFESCGLHGVFNSLEMGYDALLRRRMGILTGTDPNCDWSMLAPARRAAIVEAAKKVKDSNVRFVTEYGVTAFVNMLHAINYEKPIQYAIVDYVQLMKYEGASRNANRDTIITEVSRELMEAAKSLNITLVAMAQLNRGVEGRGGSKRPALSDIRDSGSLEQAAHYVFAPFRAEYYGINEDETGASTKGKAEILTLKNRNGVTFDYKCAFDPVLGFYDESSQIAEPPITQVQYSRNEEAIPF
jgi:hypothetical protein